MAKQGRLNLERCGYAMPADAPAYHRPPFYYRGARSIAIAFETDADAALEVLPVPLALSEPAIAALSFYEYPWSTFGPYNEAILSLMVEHKGRPMMYVQQIAVTTEPPMLGGREIWGFPKKLATIAFRSERDMIFGTLERPAGVRLASAIVRPERPAAPAPAMPRPAVSLRLIPSPEKRAERPSCAELIECETEQRLIEGWEGEGSIAFAEHSALDPWDRFPVKRVLSASYLVYDMTLGFGKVIDQLR
jgi:acetoacetate decarboxylase